MSSGAPYFWDSARGWIDAQLYVAPTENKRATPRAAAGIGTRRRCTDRRGNSPDALGEAMSQLKDVVAERQRARPGSPEHKALLEDEERLSVASRRFLGCAMPSLGGLLIRPEGAT